MARLTKAAVMQKLDEWAGKMAEANRATAQLEKAQEPIIEEYRRQLNDAGEKYIRKIERADAAAGEIESEIREWLESQPKDVRVETDLAFAELRSETITKTGPRVVDAQKFIDKATSQKKDPWTCIKVEVGKAEKLLGPADIDSVSTRSETTSSSRRASVELK